MRGQNQTHKSLNVGATLMAVIRCLTPPRRPRRNKRVDERLICVNLLLSTSYERFRKQIAWPITAGTRSLFGAYTGQTEVAFLLKTMSQGVGGTYIIIACIGTLHFCHKMSAYHWQWDSRPCVTVQIHARIQARQVSFRITILLESPSMKA
jgi:hypothetical protein